MSKPGNAEFIEVRYGPEVDALNEAKDAVIAAARAQELSASHNTQRALAHLDSLTSPLPSDETLVGWQRDAMDGEGDHCLDRTYARFMARVLRWVEQTPFTYREGTKALLGDRSREQLLQWADELEGRHGGSHE